MERIRTDDDVARQLTEARQAHSAAWSAYQIAKARVRAVEEAIRTTICSRCGRPVLDCLACP